MPNIQVKIFLLKDEYLEDSELQEKTENLLQDIKQEVEVESAGLVPVKDLPKDAMSIGGYLLGVLTAEVKLENIKPLFRFLSDRLSGGGIEVEVIAKEKTLKIKARNITELNAAIKSVQEFLGE